MLKINQKLKRVEIAKFELENEIVFNYFDKQPTKDILTMLVNQMPKEDLLSIYNGEEVKKRFQLIEKNINNQYA